MVGVRSVVAHRRHETGRAVSCIFIVVAEGTARSPQSVSDPLGEVGPEEVEVVFADAVGEHKRRGGGVWGGLRAR